MKNNILKTILKATGYKEITREELIYIILELQKVDVNYYRDMTIATLYELLEGLGYKVAKRSKLLRVKVIQAVCILTEELRINKELKKKAK